MWAWQPNTSKIVADGSPHLYHEWQSRLYLSTGLTEEKKCDGVSNNHISEEEPHSVVMEYYSLFMEAALKSSSIDKAHAFKEDAVARQLQHDLNHGTKSSIAVES